MNDSDLCPACDKPLSREDACRIVGGHVLHAQCPDPLSAAVFGPSDTQLLREIQACINRQVEAADAAAEDKVNADFYRKLRALINPKPSRDPLRVSISNSGTRYALLDVVFFEAFDMVIEDGFVTDFASTPKWLWMIYPPTGFYQRAALLHDYLYQFGAAYYGFDRAHVDWMFREQMRLDGVGWRTRWTMWAAVRLFGAKHWRAAP